MVEIVKDENKFAQTKLRKMLNNEELLAYKVEGYSGTSNYLIVDEERSCFVVYHFTFERVELGEENKKSTVFSECYVLETIPFEGMQEVSIDKFATVAHFTFNEGTVLKLSDLSNNILSFTNRLENLGMKTVKLERKWYNKVYGFRSKKKWKMAIASVVYLMLFFGVIGMFSGEDEPDVVDATEETEQVSDEEAEKAEVEKQKKLEEEKLAKKEKEEQEAEKKAEEERLAAEEQEKKEKEEADALAKKEAEEKLEDEKKDSDKLALAGSMVMILEQQFDGIATVEFIESEKTFALTPTDQRLIEEIRLLPTGLVTEEWSHLVGGLSDMSVSLSDAMGEGYSVQLLNPDDSTRALVVVVDGAVMYDVINEFY